MAQIISITSEGLQNTIRRLLPSQQGFGEDLQASNVILPVIDLTPTAEGSSVPDYLQQAWDFATSHVQVDNSSATVVNTAGFYKIDLVCVTAGTVASKTASLQLSDGFSSKIIWQLKTGATAGSQSNTVAEQEFIVFLRAGDTLSISSNAQDVIVDVSSRQLATVDGELVNPLGFSPQ